MSGNVTYHGRSFKLFVVWRLQCQQIDQWAFRLASRANWSALAALLYTWSWQPDSKICWMLLSYSVVPSVWDHVSPSWSTSKWIILYVADIVHATSNTFLSYCAHTHTQPFNGPWSGTTRLGRYQKKHSPTHTHPDHRISFINFVHLLPSIASSVFSLLASQSSLTTSLQVLFGLPRGLGPSTSYSMHSFSQSFLSYYASNFYINKTHS